MKKISPKDKKSSKVNLNPKDKTMIKKMFSRKIK
jgi:hypothetical protein